MNTLGTRGVGLEVIEGGVVAAPDQAGPVFAMLEAFARAEAQWQRAQWEPGLRSARQRAPGGGRKPSLRGAKKTATRVLYFDLTIALEQIEENSGVDRTTLWRTFGPCTKQKGESPADFKDRRDGRKVWTPVRRQRPQA